MTANDIIKKLRAGTLDNPSELANYLVQLSASLSTGGQMEVEAKISYAQKWQELRPLCKSDKQCDMRTMGTDEYRIMQMAQFNNKTLIECIRALKKKLGQLQEEMREGQNY